MTKFLFLFGIPVWVFGSYRLLEGKKGSYHGFKLKTYYRNHLMVCALVLVLILLLFLYPTKFLDLLIWISGLFS